MNPGRRPSRLLPRLAISTAAACVLAGVVVISGCNRDDRDEGRMVMQPAAPAEPGPADADTPGTEARPSDARPADHRPAPAYIYVDGVGYEFPSAKLWLRGNHGRVRARLFSDDPPEAASRDWAGDRFYFEMDLELPADAVPAGGKVSPWDLAVAEWTFRADTSERTDTHDGVFLGGSRHLQPSQVQVIFNPIGDDLVEVQVFGTFAEFDAGNRQVRPPLRHVRVQATLNAETIRR